MPQIDIYVWVLIVLFAGSMSLVIYLPLRALWDDSFVRFDKKSKTKRVD